MLHRLSHALANVYYKWLRPRTAVSINGFTGTFVTNTPALHRRVTRFGGEKEQLSAFLRELRTGDVVWDVGSFVGIFSLFASKAVGSSGKVYAFEPEPHTSALLQRNCELNSAHNVKIVNAALSDTDGGGEIFSANEGANAIHSLKPGGATASKGLSIKLRRGDSLVNAVEADVPNVIKMDIEGAELLAFKGLKETLAKPACRFVFLELHHQDLPRFGARSEDVLSFMQQVGFEVRQKIERGTESHVFFHKTGT
jgi:FkbM family methyltransferase